MQVHKGDSRQDVEQVRHAEWKRGKSHVAEFRLIELGCKSQLGISLSLQPSFKMGDMTPCYSLGPGGQRKSEEKVRTHTQISTRARMQLGLCHIPYTTIQKESKSEKTFTNKKQQEQIFMTLDKESISQIYCKITRYKSAWSGGVENSFKTSINRSDMGRSLSLLLAWPGLH